MIIDTPGPASMALVDLLTTRASAIKLAEPGPSPEQFAPRNDEGFDNQTIEFQEKR